MRFIDTDALRTVLSSLGIGAPSTATQQVSFDDDNLQQVLDTNVHVRRGSTVFPSEGIFGIRFDNVHAIAGSVLFESDIFNLGAALALPPFPQEVDSRFDIWLLGGSATASVAGLNDVSSLQVLMPASMTSTAVIGAVGPIHAMWDGQASKGAATAEQLTANGDVSTAFQGVPMRLRPGTTLRWRTTSLIAGTLSYEGLIGLFPASLGQDVR